MKTFLFSKKHSSSYFLNFFHVQSFPTFCWKNLMIRVEMKFLRNNTILYAFYSKFATLRVFEKIQVFFRKTHLFFLKRPKFRKFWGILLFQAHSTANLLQFGQKIISRSVAWTYLPMWRERNWQTSGKKTSEVVHLSGTFCFDILKNMAQNKKALKFVRKWKTDACGWFWYFSKKRQYIRYFVNLKQRLNYDNVIWRSLLKKIVSGKSTRGNKF